jgi:hypothetical protein
VGFCKLFAQIFAEVFRDRVRADWPSRGIGCDPLRRGVTPRDGQAAGVHESTHSGQPGRIEHVPRSLDVHVEPLLVERVTLEVPFVSGGDRRMHDGVHTLHRGAS